MPAGVVAAAEIDAIAAGLPEWPRWPTPGLSSLVGPSSVALRSLDLRWLHRVEATVRLLGRLSGRLGGPIGGPTAVSLLVERAALLGHRGWGTSSAGGSCRLLPATGPALAVNLARPDDLDAVPAWLEADVGDNVWTAVEHAAATRPIAELLARAELLGLPVAAVAEATAAPLDTDGPDVTVRRPPLVVDLSSLWAGPLCGWYLARTGADVVKVEAAHRPDGGRHGAPAFYTRLNEDKHVRDLDLLSEAGRRELRRLVRAADIVIEASRPRALEALGVDALAEVARGAIWCSITGHGRAAGTRVGFGDDAAVAGGLVARVGTETWFIGDAAADPIAGATAAAMVLARWLAGQAGLLDVGLAPTVAMHVRADEIRGATWSPAGGGSRG